jgi:capsid portal protein
MKQTEIVFKLQKRCLDIQNLKSKVFKVQKFHAAGILNDNLRDLLARILNKNLFDFHPLYAKIFP